MGAWVLEGVKKDIKWHNRCMVVLFALCVGREVALSNPIGIGGFTVGFVIGILEGVVLLVIYLAVVGLIKILRRP